MYCWQCGTKALDDAKFCGECGARIGKPAEENVDNDSVDVKSVFSNISIGDIVNFGKYYQKDTETKESVEWLVLDVEKDKFLAISKYILDVHAYGEMSKNYWCMSEIRKWMNGPLYRNLFDAEERKKICTYIPKETLVFDVRESGDKIFLLSEDQAQEYFINDKQRCAKSTTYARERGGYFLKPDESWPWWLMDTVGFGINAYVTGADSCSSGFFETYVTGADSYLDVGQIDSVSSESGYIGVRPAIWIKK